MKNLWAKANERFNDFAKTATDRIGSLGAFLTALVALLVWGVVGKLLGMPSWVIDGGNLTISVVTLFTMFALQNSQNRDSSAVHLKLDELLRAQAEAHTEIAKADSMTPAEVQAKRAEIADLCDDYEAPASGDEPVQTAPGCGV